MQRGRRIDRFGRLYRFARTHGIPRTAGKTRVRQAHKKHAANRGRRGHCRTHGLRYGVRFSRARYGCRRLRRAAGSVQRIPFVPRTGKGYRTAKYRRHRQYNDFACRRKYKRHYRIRHGAGQYDYRRLGTDSDRR